MEDFRSMNCPCRLGQLSSSLSDLGNRSEARGKSSPFFRSFEAHSENYATKKIGEMGWFPIAAVDFP
jgi:hypothetical protein